MPQRPGSGVRAAAAGSKLIEEFMGDDVRGHSLALEIRQCPPYVGEEAHR